MDCPVFTSTGTFTGVLSKDGRGWSPDRTGTVVPVVDFRGVRVERTDRGSRNLGRGISVPDRDRTLSAKPRKVFRS